MRLRWKWLLPVMLCGILFTTEDGASAAALDGRGRMQTQALPSEEADPGISSSWYLDKVGIRPVWEKLEAEGRQPGEGIVIAVIDTGLASSATCLNDARWCNEAELNGKDGVDDDGNGYVDDVYGLNLANRYAYQTDSVGHGTEIAGLIGMQPGDGGGAGLAYGARIMPIKVSQDTNYDTDSVVEGIRYAVKMGADVINMSFATYDPSDLLEEAVREAAKSCVMVAAAGNEGFVTQGKLSRQEVRDMGYTCMDAYPAAWDCCIGVMAGSVGGGLAEFTNWDQEQDGERKYDIVAPGEMLYTVSKGNRYTTVKGTSYATALVSAAVAVYMGCLGEEMEAPELTDRFLATMTQKTEFYCAGREFAYPALTMEGILNELSGAEEPMPGAAVTTEQKTGADATTEQKTGADAATEERPDADATTEQKTGTGAATEERPGADATTEQKTGTGAATEERPDAAVTTEQKTEEALCFGRVSSGKKKLAVVIKKVPEKGKLKVTLTQAYGKGKKRTRACRLSVKGSRAEVTWRKLKAKKFQSGKAVLRLEWKRGGSRIKRTRKIRLKL